MNSTSLFSDRATDYALYRPSYPVEAITTILEGFDSSQLVAADIGAGTGIASRLLGDRGVKVIAVEPNEEMRLAATEHPMVEFRDATAEVTGLSSASVDLVTCFQSFHWFNPSPTLLEFRRILKSSGQLALVWGVWDEDDSFTKELDRLVLQASNNTPGLPNRNSIVNALLENPHFQKVRQTNVPYQQWLDLRGLIGLAQSQGFVPLSGKEQQHLVTELQNLYEQVANSSGKVCVVYSTDVYLAEPVA